MKRNETVLSLLLDPDSAGDVALVGTCSGFRRVDDEASAAQRHLEQRSPFLWLGAVPAALPVLTACPLRTL